MELARATHSRLGDVAIVVTLAAAVGVVYFNTLHNPFVLDDRFVIADNRSIRDLRDVRRVLSPPQNGAPVQGRPVANLSFAVDYALGGEAVVGYHLTNVALHLANCLLLFALVRRTLRLPQLTTLATQATPIAFATALLWAVHPLATAAVGYVSQRTELLATFFYLLTLYFVLRGTTAESRRGTFDVLAVVCCALGMASKEVMVTAPLVALLFERTFIGGPWRTWIRRRGITYVALFSTWILLAALVIHSGSRGGTAGLGAGVSPWRYLLTQCTALLLYVKLSLWPHPLIFDYGPALAAGVREVWPAAVVVLLLLGAMGVLLWRFPRAAFIALAWLIVLAPSSSVIPVRTQTIAEHRAYLPLAIILIGTVTAASYAVGRTKRPFAAPALATLLASVTIALAFLTVRRNADYHTALGLWRDTLAKRPNNPRTYLNVGVLEFGPRGDYASAIQCFTEALRLDPDFTPALVNRSSVYVATGQREKALADAERLVQIIPNEAQAYLSRAAVYESMGQFDREIQDTTVAIRLNPEGADAYYDRGNGYIALGQHAMAAADYAQAVRLKPGEPRFWFNYGNALTYLQQYEAALEEFDRAIALKPDWADAYLNRGIAQTGRGRHALAIADFTRAAELKPAWSEPYLDRAASHAELKEYEKAWEDVRAARQRGGTPHPEFIRLLTAASGHGE
jgi:tetratricopeptide (TPR) repeat protein